MRYSKKTLIRIGIATAVVFFMFVAGYFLLSDSQGPVSSIEVGFVSLSPNGHSGGFVIPASCPSFEDFPGQCAPPPPSPPVVSISASPNPVEYGQGSTLSWSATNDPTSCTASGSWSGSKPASGSEGTGDLTTAQTYTLSCSNAGGTGENSVTVNILPGDFNLSLGGAAACNSVPLSWTASGAATAYRILEGTPRVDISPYQPYTALNFSDTSVSQNTDYLYQIEAYNSVGDTRSNALNVTTPFCPPTLTFSGDPTTVFQGQSTTLTWSSTFTSSCVASGAWTGSKPLNGSEVVVPNPPPSVTYNLQCSGPGGSTAVQPVTINITPLALPDWKEIIPR